MGDTTAIGTAEAGPTREPIGGTDDLPATAVTADEAAMRTGMADCGVGLLALFERELPSAVIVGASGPLIDLRPMVGRTAPMADSEVVVVERGELHPAH